MLISISIHYRQIRSLSCRGLMATIQNDTPLIYLVDSTVYLRVRALYLGAGSNSINKFKQNVLYLSRKKSENKLVFYGRQLVESILSKNFQKTRLSKWNRWIYERKLFGILLQNFSRKGLLPIRKKKR